MGERIGKQSIVKDNQQSSETEVRINKKVSKCVKSCAKVVHGSEEQKNLVITIHLKRRMEHKNNQNSSSSINSIKSNLTSTTATSPSTAATKSNHVWDEKHTNSINNNNNINNNINNSNNNNNSKKNPTTTKSNDTNNNSNVKHNCNGAVSKNDSGYKGLVKYIFSSKGNNDNINNNNSNNNSSITTTTAAVPTPAPIATVVPNKNSYTRVVVSHIDRSTSTCPSAADIEHSFNALAISPNHQFVNALTGNTMDVVNQIPHDNRRHNPDEYQVDDCDERARIKRAFDIQEGIEIDKVTTIIESCLSSPLSVNNDGIFDPQPPAQQPQQPLQPCFLCSDHQLGTAGISVANKEGEIMLVHSQDYYMHCLVPDLQKITACCYYWGKMDRYEAERLLDSKPEGTFLLRDSAQDDYLFSVSFRKYGRSLHARVEQFNHQFSFDSHDPSVFTAQTVTGLVEHYKDPTSVMFFEPMLTSPLHRNYCFSLQQLCRAAIVSNTTYDGINNLCLPSTMKSYLKEYHYKQRVRVKRFDEHIYQNS